MKKMPKDWRLLKEHQTAERFYKTGMWREGTIIDLTNPAEREAYEQNRKQKLEAQEQARKLYIA